VLGEAGARAQFSAGAVPHRQRRPQKVGHRLRLLVLRQEWTTRTWGSTAPRPTERDINTGIPIPLDRWSHVAAVFGPRQTVVYLNGKEVGRGAATGSEGGTTFVVGNAGETNISHYFVGRIRTVRISRGERYLGPFVPAKAFAADEQAVLLYSADRADALKVSDLSGRGNDGILQGVRANLP
jgi:hypothetical protein